jgi:amino acid permease
MSAVNTELENKKTNKDEAVVRPAGDVVDVEKNSKSWRAPEDGILVDGVAEGNTDGAVRRTLKQRHMAMIALGMYRRYR